ncbi:unnamed protein product [Schistocephalus solidus]|uniref:ribose-5-phosphate isomerase n=1 Tax=Schistocephalus solidus TaxID=70667 RepID=A0A3P7CUT8_SCHSO|nr:unnamed protein product [Schistocephalus solidus]
MNIGQHYFYLKHARRGKGEASCSDDCCGRVVEGRLFIFFISWGGTTVVYAVKRICTQCFITFILDVTFDGVDEMTPDFNSIKGGGGCLLQEKIVGYNAKSFVVIADESKRASYLGEKWKRGLPIEVVPMASTTVKNEIERRFGGVAKLRMAVSKMGPVVTDNGNFLLDWQFDADPSINWRQMDIDLHLIPGTEIC